MKLDDIRAALGKDREDVERLHESFLEETPSNATLDGFVGWLFSEGQLTNHEFRTLAADHEVVLTGQTRAGASSGGASRVPSVPKVRVGHERLTHIGKLAEGAMGEIHVVRDEALQRTMALKRMSERIASHPVLAARFLNEAQVTAQLDHPNIVPVHSLEPTEEGRLTYTMKLVRGRTLTELITATREHYDSGRPLDEAHRRTQRLEYFARVCEAVAYAHSRGVIHRDLKPDNVMVGELGEVYVMDWGIARFIGGSDDAVSLSADELGAARTQLGTVIGTPAYMSPEQAEGSNTELDGRSDQFSLGLMLYELVSLQPAVKTRDTLATLLRIQRAELEPLEHYGGRKIPADLAAIIRKATCRSTTERYPSVKALVADLRRFQRGEETAAYPDNFPRKVTRWFRSHPGAAGLAVSVMTVLLLLLAVWSLYARQANLLEGKAREQRLASVLSVVSRQSHSLDAQLLTFEGLLKVLSANAIEAVSWPDEQIGHEGDSYFLGDQFSPPDLSSSPVYGRDVSIGWPVISVADSVSREEATPAVRQLTLLRQPFRRLLLRSASEESVGVSLSRERTLLLHEGVPLARASVALESGVYAQYPGHSGFPPGYDARKRPWYRLAEEAPRGPQWSTPQVDVSGLGLMLPCYMSLYDDDGLFMGVAGIELTFDYIIELMQASELPNSQAYILDQEGRVVVDAKEVGRTFDPSAAGRRVLRLKNFHTPEARAGLKERPVGNVVARREAGEDALVVWYRMDAIGWYYVVELDAAEVWD